MYQGLLWHSPRLAHAAQSLSLSVHPEKKTNVTNKPFMSSLVPLFQTESKNEIIVITITVNCMKMKLHTELVFI